MADLTGIEVTDMPSANSVGSADYFMIVQSGVNKKAPKSLVLQGIATEDETGNKIDLEINSSTYVMVAKLYDKNNVLLSTSSPIDLPLETMVVGAEYDKETKEIVLTLKNGTTVRFSVADLVDGLVSEDTFNAAVDALQNEINNIASQIVTTETKEDTEFTINDTFDSLMKVGIKGNTEQDTTTGKQLFNKNGVTRINGVITETNYWVSGESAYSFRFPIQPNTIYTISANNPEETIFRAGVSNTENLPVQRKCRINKCYKIYKH